MSEYAEMFMFAVLAFAVAVALPAVVALFAGLFEYVRARRDRDEISYIVGDVPRNPRNNQPD